MKVLRKAFDDLFEQLEKPQISWRKFKIDPNKPEGRNLIGFSHPDQNTIREVYDLTINGLDEKSYRELTNSLIEKFFVEVKLNLKSPILHEELDSHMMFLKYKFKEADVQITKAENSYKLCEVDIDEDYKIKYADEIQQSISNYFYEQKLIVRKTVNRLNDILKKLSKEIETTLKKEIAKLLPVLDTFEKLLCELEVRIVFGETRLLLDESYSAHLAGEIQDFNDDDFSWNHITEVNGFTSPNKFSKKLFNLRKTFYQIFPKELIAKENEFDRKLYLISVQQFFKDCKELIEPSGIKSYISYGYYIDGTHFNINETYNHSNKKIVLENEFYETRYNGKDITCTKTTNLLGQYFVSLFIRIQLFYVESILSYFNDLVSVLDKNENPNFILKASDNARSTSKLVVPPKSFKLIGAENHHDKLKEMFHELKFFNFLSKESPIKGFYYLFLEKDISTPLVWTKANGSLRYFILELERRSIIHKTTENKWLIVISAFENKKPGVKYKIDQVSQAKTKDVSKQQLRQLDEIINMFQPTN